MKTRFLILLAAVALLTCCERVPVPETPPGHPVQLPAPRVPDDPDYDPHLLIPQWDWRTGRWGYIDRTSREPVIPHMFRFAGRLQRGVAYAVTWDTARAVSDLYRVTADGRHTRIHEGRPEYGITASSGYDYQRTGDDYFFLRQGEYHALFDPEGARLWDTLCHPWTFILAGAIPAYLGAGHTALLSGGHYEFRDRDFRTLARFDTSRYHIYVPDEWPDWVRSGHRIPLIPALDRQTDKVGFLDHRGHTRIPFVWDRTGDMGTGRVRWDDIDSHSSDYRTDGHDRYLVYRDGHQCLIDSTGGLIYECPDSLELWGHPAAQYNRRENSQVMRVRDKYRCHVVDLDDGRVLFSAPFIHRLNDSLYIIETYRDRKRRFDRMVDAQGREVPNDIPSADGKGWYVELKGDNAGMREVRSGEKRSVISGRGKLVTDWRLGSVDYWGYQRPDNYMSFYTYRVEGRLIKEKVRETMIYLPTGDTLAGKLTNVDFDEDYFSRAVSNSNWSFETASNALFYLDFKWQGHRCKGYIDALGHYYILD